MGSPQNLSRQRFGRLVPICIDGESSEMRPHWLCICDCGGAAIVRASHLKRGETQSCGCLAREIAGGRVRTHGQSKTRTYKSWHSMRSRCSNANDPSYGEYGGRGIRVDRRWNWFETFLSDMGERPAGCSLERIDFNGDYTPGNCVWATATTQNRNKRDNLVLVHDGRSQPLSAWAQEFGLADNVLRKRISTYGWAVERALRTPKAARKPRGIAGLKGRS